MTKGLYNKYIIHKANGEEVTGDYFVLRLDEEGDPDHVKACREAVLTYAQHIEHYLPVLAHDLKQKYTK